jgi:outer membrane receptor protein involved in Fe transport
MYTLTTLNGRGTFTFDGSYTQNPLSRTGTGSGVADVELGLAQTVVTSTVGLSNLRADNDFWYIQDDWKVSPRLTLNFGLRYELYWPLYEANNGLANFWTDRTNSNFGKMTFVGLNGQSRSMMEVDPHNLAPRFGFAWRVPHSGDLVIRGGYGIFYGSPDEQTGVGSMMTNNPPFVGLGAQNIIGDHNQPSTAFNLSNSLPPFPSPVSPQNFVFNPASKATLYSWPTYYKTPIVQQWNLRARLKSIVNQPAYVP